MRLRQIALVGADLAACAADIEAVLGVSHPYDDPGVGHYGLRKGVWAVGETFLEVVSPKLPGTTAGRLIEKRGGDGGYMVILQVRDLAAARRTAAEAGARVVEQIDRDGVAATHYHPRDTGGAILSLDWMDPWMRWEWGGPDWKTHAQPGQAIVGAELQAGDPAAMAARWGEVLGREAERSGETWRIALEGGEIRFVPLRDERGDGLAGFDVALPDPAAARALATRRGLLDADGEIRLCGSRLYLAGARR
ncbi:MAG: hypothetical protein EON95_11495 [Caulobacteraceae bacterium]|nr:MAG: hypothetical protein EON95_11495 [Caulobacteraceae bacterium]